MLVVLTFMATICFYFLELYQYIAPTSILAMYLVVRRYRKYIKAAYVYNDDYVYVRGGIYGEKHELMPTFKIQGISIHQSPYQTNHQLCSINIYTAAGAIGIPYIPYTAGKLMVDKCLLLVERSRKKWM